MVVASMLHGVCGRQFAVCLRSQLSRELMRSENDWQVDKHMWNIYLLFPGLLLMCPGNVFLFTHQKVHMFWGFPMVSVSNGVISYPLALSGPFLSVTYLKSEQWHGTAAVWDIFTENCVPLTQRKQILNNATSKPILQNKPLKNILFSSF